MTAVLGWGASIARDRLGTGRRGARAVARPDEDAITFAVEAAGPALGDHTPQALVLASTTPPYELGGSTQPLAELLGLQGSLLTYELTATDRDGLAAVRLAMALAQAGVGPVLVCGAHVDRDDRRTGDGAIALLVGEGEGLVDLAPAGSYVEELRDRWRLPGTLEVIDGDRSFVESIGTTRLGRTALASLPDRNGLPVLVTGPDARAAAALQRELGGAPDPVLAALGHLGAAQALLQLVLAEEPSYVLSLAAGQAECLVATPSPAAADRRTELRTILTESGTPVDRVSNGTTAADFDPYASVPRAWRERDVDLRLKGMLPDGAPVPGRNLPTGRVVTWTSDFVYPGGSPTDMAAVDIDGGGRFFGQVTPGDHVEIGDAVRLVPRRLHEGGGLVQYFWKVTPCR
ncbi:MAG: hydroxymethylglutaryl-CoA synthase [Conexibacter sp.]|nr:hydroxymethylglutaryl-CoA synthase [Conexibacter sp.]